MGARITVEVVSILLITVLIAVLGFVVFLGDGDFTYGLSEAFRFLFGPTGIAVGLWALLLVVFAIVLRRRPAWVRVLVHLGSLVLANVVNLGVLLVLASTSADSWFGLVVAIAFGVGLILFIAAVVGVLVTELLILRALPVRAPAPAPAQP